jgi:crotonobetainyl-CoA:carnitine CoA-transferase CaiB-like acyl-CoA transferase
MIMGDLGADVIKVESPTGDETRRWGPPFVDGIATYYFGANRNKSSVVLDLSTDRDRETLFTLMVGADVVIHNFTTDAATRLGADYAAASRARADVVHLSFSGFGRADPRRGYDLVAQAMSGLMASTGDPDRSASKVGAPVSDLAAALFGVIGVVSALYARRDTGVGAELHVSLYDASLALLANQSMNWLLAGEDTRRLGSEHPSITPYGAYRTSDGDIVLAVGSDGQFAALCDVLDTPDLAKQFPRNEDRIASRNHIRLRLEEVLGSRTRAEWISLLTAAGVPNAEVRSVGEALSAPETTLSQVTDALGTTLPQIPSPIRVNGKVQEPFLSPPSLGEHTDRLLNRGQRTAYESDAGK